MTPIPPHLAAYPWYAPHLAWLVESKLTVRHVAPDGTVAVRANLADAYLARANLTGADLAGANLAGADLTGANLAGAFLAGAIGIATADEEAATWASVRTQVLLTPERLQMNDWHCGTSHCVAGWAQELSTDPEIKAMAPWLAGSRLLPRHAYLFGASDDTVLALMRAEVSE